MPWLANYPREQVPWHPVVDLDSCVQSGMCMNCGHKVYDWTPKGPAVMRPNACVVGCTSCANLCRSQCISFPDPNEVRKLYRENHIWDAVKETLQDEGVIPKE